jgi:predicted dehydrogenase
VGYRDSYDDLREVRWGVLGAGHISHRFASSLKEVDGARLVAAAGRTPSHVEGFCRAFSIDAAHSYATADGSGDAAYDALIADPDVDAIYLALPHGMHTRWACRALRAGKAVLCEKPAVLSEEEALSISSASREHGVLFMEAMKNRFCPMRTRVKGLLASGELGCIVSIESVQKLDYGQPPSSYLLDPLQGGCLYDMGCYAVGWFEDLLAGACDVSSREVRWRDVSGGRVDWADEIHMSVGGIPIHMVYDGKAA